MSRSTNAVPSRAKRKRIVKQAKGRVGRSKNCSKLALRSLEKGWQYAYRDRKAKKRDFRSLWISRLNAALRDLGYKYSTFIAKLDKSDLGLDRKVLANMASSDIVLFNSIVQKLMLN